MANTCNISVLFDRPILIDFTQLLKDHTVFSIDRPDNRTINFGQFSQPSDETIASLTQYSIPFRAQFDDLPMGLAGFYEFDGVGLKKHTLEYGAAVAMFSGEPINYEDHIVNTEEITDGVFKNRRATYNKL